MPQFSPETVAVPCVGEHEPADRRLEDHRGLLVAYITKSQSIAMQCDSKIRKIGKRCFRLSIPVVSSSSNPSPSMLTGGSSGWRGGHLTRGDGGDMHKVAGTAFSRGRRLHEIDRERLIGYGFAV